MKRKELVNVNRTIVIREESDEEYPLSVSHVKVYNDTEQLEDYFLVEEGNEEWCLRLLKNEALQLAAAIQQLLKEGK